MKSKLRIETFTRTKPWYEVTPSSRFIYRDKVTNLWFVIEKIGERSELQGAGYAIITAYKRYKSECEKLKTVAKPLDSFQLYDKLDKVMSYQVKY